MKKSIVFILLISLCLNMFAQNDAYYDKHIIIAVDQKVAAKATPSSKYGKAMDALYVGLKEILSDPDSREGINESMSKISSDFKFDPNTDCISLFAFGIPQGNTYNKAKNEIFNNYRFNIIPNNLIRKRGMYNSEGDKDFSSFIDEDLKDLFTKDPLMEEYRRNGILGIALSHYVYPLILNYIQTNVKAKEYYLLIISDFTATIGTNDSEDRYRINELTSCDSKKFKQFHEEVNEISALYTATEAIKIIPEGFGERQGLGLGQREEFPFIHGKKLLLDACMNSTAFISSEIDFKQQELYGKEYTLAPVTITFNHNEDIKLEKIKFTLKDKKGTEYINETYSDRNTLDDLHNSTQKTYKLPLFENIKINDLAEGDTLYFEYTFYTKSDTEDNREHITLLPYVFTANRDFAVNEAVFVPIPVLSEGKSVAILVGGILLFIALMVATYFLYKYRGKNRKITLDFSIRSVSNERFMEVKDKQVLNYDCWYWEKGQSDRNIHVAGTCNVEDKFLAKDYQYVVEYQIQDADNNEDFSFRPGTEIMEKDGSLREANKWYEAGHNNNEFDFNANVYISDGSIPAPHKEPNFEFDNILKLKVGVRVKIVDNKNQIIAQNVYFDNGNGESVNYLEKYYTFIVKPKLQNSNLWMAFDPGTTGSCVAYGVSSLPNATDDIYMANNRTQNLRNEWENSSVFPSIIRINKKSERIFNGDPIVAQDLVEGSAEDFVFGNQALILSKGGYGANTFQSIKKLLGYNTPQKIMSNDGRITEIAGQDLAHMLVKGLYNKVESYITDNAPDDVKQMFMQNGSFTPQRAIVAVPNNYTIVKIQEMVDSVKRMGVFKEVHYIYESEAVMMTYLRENWSRLITDTAAMQERVFVVYDMGGATINATAFKLKIYTYSRKGNTNIRSVNVETIAKVGYCVGGDDIDYALIKMIYDAPSVKVAIADPESHQRKYKAGLIALARKIKLDWIDTIKGKNSDTQSIETFWHNIQSEFKRAELGSINLPAEFSDADKRYFEREGIMRSNMEKYVLGFVGDAVKNLFATIEANSRIELIMSGRSVLYPGVRENVEKAIKGSNCSDITLWDGYNDESGHFSSEKVKSAVATGACWYAMYSDKINMRNDIITTSFGYLEMVNGEQIFRPMIERGSKFDEHGECKSTIDTLSELQFVRFIQMMGMDYDTIWTENLKHKMNILDEIRGQSISDAVDRIEITIDNKNNFSYNVYESNGVTITKEKNPFSRLTQGNNIKTEIVDENSDAYIYATLNPLVENEEETKNNEIEDSATTRRTTTRTTRTSTGGTRRF